jgi:rhodanese-related sulfurtransferase
MRYVLFTVIAAAVIAAVCAGCAKQGGEAANRPDRPGGEPSAVQGSPTTGGTSDYTDHDAPKKVDSREIVSFEFGITVMGDAPEDSILTARRYDFTAKLEDGAVTCTRSWDGNEPVTFTKDGEFLENLQKIVEKFDFAQYNGYESFTHGLPDDFGENFRIEYASGEKIYASDNQGLFMPIGSAEELAELFACYAPSPYGYTSVSMDAAMEMMRTEEDYVIVDVRRQDEYDAGHIPGAVCVPNEAIQDRDDSVSEALPDRDRLIFVYCRSGRRSKQAAKVLFDMDYTRVYEIGGINGWPGEIEKN